MVTAPAFFDLYSLRNFKKQQPDKKENKMKKIISLVALTAIYFGFISSAFQQSTQNVNINAAVLNVSGVINPLSDSLPYLGQPRPDTIPLRFGPPYLLSNGVWWWHGSPKFSPDGKEMFFVKYYSNLPSGNAKMYIMLDENAQWTYPAPPVFASDSIDNSPVYSQDGNTLYFTSYRSGSMKIYYVTRTFSGWAQPLLLNMAYQSLPGMMGWDFCFTNDSTMYFPLYVPADGLDIYMSHPVNGQYSQFEKLPSQINTSYNEATPYIDPDEKFIMFMSNRPGGYGYHDIYISFRKEDGSWTDAQNMGFGINGPSEDAFPWITFDGKYLFFNSEKGGDLGYNAYWVDSKVIDKFKPPIGIKGPGELIPKDMCLFQNYPNPFNPSTKIRFRINKYMPVTLKVYDIRGQEIAVLVNEKLQAGEYEAPFSSDVFSNRHISSGIYFYSLSAGSFRQTRKMILLK
jgi:hypothetical protein